MNQLIKLLQTQGLRKIEVELLTYLRINLTTIKQKP